MDGKANHLPANQAFLTNGFLWYSRRFMKKRFHTFAIDDRDLLQNSIPEDAPLIVYANHPGWWDPIVAALLKDAYFPDRLMYSPIDAKALKKYQVLGKMGFYGLDLDSSAGARHFLQVSASILETRGTSIWITPEGQFCDVRNRKQALMPGLAHLAHRTPNIHCVPLAIEYSFWEEALPEALCRLGKPVVGSPDQPLSKQDWSEQLTQGLRENQDLLAQNVIARNTDPFRILLGAGQSRSWYNFFRAVASRLQGKKFVAEHGNKFNNLLKD